MPTQSSLQDFANFKFYATLTKILDVVAPNENSKDAALAVEMTTISGIEPRFNCICKPPELAIVLDLIETSSKTKGFVDMYIKKLKTSHAKWKNTNSKMKDFLPKETSFFWNIGVKGCSPSFGNTLKDEIGKMTSIDISTVAAEQASIRDGLPKPPEMCPIVRPKKQDYKGTKDFTMKHGRAQTEEEKADVQKLTNEEREKQEKDFLDHCDTNNILFNFVATALLMPYVANISKEDGKP